MNNILRRAPFFLMAVACLWGAATTSAAAQTFGSANTVRVESLPERQPNERQPDLADLTATVMDHGEAVSPRLGDFGLALVDVDPETIRELAPFSSLIDISWSNPDLIELISLASSTDMKPLIALHDLFFVRDDTSTLAIRPWSLRPDFQARWDAFVGRNRAVLGSATVWAFYLVDEPFLNGVPLQDLFAADRAVHATFPLIPTMSSLNQHDIGAAPADLPADFLDIVGYHVYAVPEDPNIDAAYQLHLDLLQEKFPDRDLVIVADAWWSEGRHGVAGFDNETLIERATQYRRVAEEVGAIALGAFVWQDIGSGTGLRQLPEEVLREYIRIGAEISGRCGVPAEASPLAGEAILHLQGCRFSAKVHWRDPITGEEGEGIAARLTADTGVFWFFGPSNIELTLKVLDGTALNGHWWVYWSDMTNLEVRLEITDTATGAVKIYRDPARDTSAFAD